MEKIINRIKVVLAEQQKTNRWLASELEVSEATVSKWCTNKAQPRLDTLLKISKLLGVHISELVKT